MKVGITTLLITALWVNSAYAQTTPARTNMEAILASLKVAKIKWKSSSDKVCFNDNACTVFADGFQISTVGKTAEVFPSSEKTANEYAAACAVVLAGLTQTSIKVAMGYVQQGFMQAASGGRGVYTISGTEMKIAPKFDSRLWCNFVKF